MPKIPGGEHIISSDGFFELETLPKKGNVTYNYILVLYLFLLFLAVVIGAGYIAVELAGIWHALGKFFYRIFYEFS